MSDLLNIAGREIGPGQPAFVIAEIGVNHDGLLARAIELVEAAHAAGADAVKLQLFQARQLMHPRGGLAEYQKQRVGDESPVDMLRRYELSDDELEYIVRRIIRLGMVALATPFSPADVDRLLALNLPAIKLASPDLVNRVLLSRALETRLPLILSTGAATMEEVQATCVLLKQKGADFGLMHCISSYPTQSADAHLGWIEQLGTVHPIVGYSDHTTDLLAGAIAVARGACIVEKHLTYDRSALGPDHSASADPGQFAEYVRSIRLAQTLLGTGSKRVLDCERDVRQVSRQSLVAAVDIAQGAVIGPGDLTVQRPGTGIGAWEIDKVVGCRTAHSIPAGTMLNWKHLIPRQQAA